MAKYSRPKTWPTEGLNLKSGSTYKIVIIGAGPAGCSCAMALLNAGIENVLLIDNSKTGKFHIGESIPPDMNPILKKLGIYESFIAQNHEPCFGSCSYWGSDLRGYNDSILSPYGHGWHLDREQFNHLLIKEATKRGAKILSQCSYKNSEKNKSGYRLLLKEQNGEIRSVETDVVIDATGTRAVFATEQGSLKKQGKSLVCIGLRFKNKSNRQVSKLTHLESVENGWWYATRIPGEHLLVTFYTTARVVKKLGLYDLNNWVKLLQEAPNTHSWISGMEPVEERTLGFNAPSFCLDKIARDSWMAIGDAATTYDPITSQGIIKSVTHGMRAAEIIGHYIMGSKEALFQFENEVKEQYKIYQDSRCYFYELEQRWPKSDFWAEIHKSTSPKYVSNQHSF